MINDPAMRAVDIATGGAIAFREGDYCWTGATISRNGRLIATGGWPGWSPRIFDRKTGERVGYCLHDEFAGPNGLTFSPDARYLACTYPDGTLVLYDLTTAGGGGAEQVVTLPGFEIVSSLSFDSSGGRLVCGLLDGSVELRRIEIPQLH
jgi:WD40 repeat protein